MITGSFTNQDGGLHPEAVAQIHKLTVDFVQGTATVQVDVFHDLAAAAIDTPAPGVPRQPRRPLGSPSYVLKDATFTTDPAKIEEWLMTQPNYKGWTVVPPKV